MTWKDELRPASYRGVPFFVRSDTLGGGKRIQIHTYPERDEPYIEELGREPRTFTVVAHLIGGDVWQQRERLVAALEAPGPGKLVLPSRGELLAVCDSIGRNTELAGAEGRISRLELSFVRAGANRFPTAAVDTQAAVRIEGDGTLAAIGETFAAAFDVVRQANWVVDNAATAAVAVVDQLLDAFDEVATADDDVSDAIRSLRRARTGIDDLLLEPAELVQELQEPYRALAVLTAPAPQLFGRLQNLSESTLFVNTAETVGTPSRSQNAANLDALERLNRRTALVGLALTGLRLEPDSAQDAAELREQLAGMLRAEADVAAEAGEDGDFLALSDLLAAVVEDLDERAGRLPERRSVVNPATWPALVLAYRVHGDLEREEEIVQRNAIRRPGFVEQGRLIELVGGQGP